MSSSEENRELRNAVFAAQQAVENAKSGNPQQVHHTPVTNTSAMMPQNRVALEIELPAGNVELPSSGLVYSTGALRGAHAIEIRAMTAKEEDILLNRTLIKRGTVITELIKSCVTNPDINIGSMLSGDRNALMIAIRITGYGAEYSPKIECPKCEVEQEMLVNLSDLQVKSLNLENLKQVTPFSNEFLFTLPTTKREVVFRFLTGADEERILQDAEARKKKGIVQDNLVTTRLINSVVSIDGNTDRSAIAKFCTYMPALDSSKLRKHIDANEPQIDMTNQFVCKSCGHQEVIAIPLGLSFFWPNS